MARFTVRVELHEANDFSYLMLHTSMLLEDFSRQIASEDGVVYHLPPAEYNREGDLTKEDVLASAKRAAAKTDKEATILVTESVGGRKWSNLKRVA